MAVVADVTLRIVVFAHHAGHVADTQHVPRRIAPDDLIGDLSLAGKRWCDMDGSHRGGVVDRAARGRQPLCSQGRNQRMSPIP